MRAQKTIELIKRSYDQPILFHMLHCHLAHVLRKGNPLHDVSDEWSRMLVLSAVQSRSANQALEAKILSFLKEIRPPLSSKGTRLRLWIVLYYMRNRSPDQVNHLVLFELVCNFMGVSAFVDGLILSVLGIALAGPSFGLEGNRKLRDEGIVHMLGIVRKKVKGVLCRALALPCYVGHDVEPAGVQDVTVANDAQTLAVLESVCFYAKYARSVGFVKRIVPDGAFFVDALRRFISKSFEVDRDGEAWHGAGDCVVENTDILDEIRKGYEEARDKKRFVSMVVEFAMGLGA